MPPSPTPECERCHDGTPATTRQAYRDWDASDPRYMHWSPHETLRCDRCAQDLRDYAALSRISTVIVTDEALA